MIQTKTPAANVVAAWRRWRLTSVYAGRKTCKLALLFGRASPPLAPNRALVAVLLSRFRLCCNGFSTSVNIPVRSVGKQKQSNGVCHFFARGLQVV